MLSEKKKQTRTIKPIPKHIYILLRFPFQLNCLVLKINETISKMKSEIFVFVSRASLWNCMCVHCLFYTLTSPMFSWICNANKIPHIDLRKFCARTNVFILLSISRHVVWALLTANQTADKWYNVTQAPNTLRFLISAYRRWQCRPVLTMLNQQYANTKPHLFILFMCIGQNFNANANWIRNINKEERTVHK